MCLQVRIVLTDATCKSFTVPDVALAIAGDQVRVYATTDNKFRYCNASATSGGNKFSDLGKGILSEPYRATGIHGNPVGTTGGTGCLFFYKGMGRRIEKPDLASQNFSEPDMTVFIQEQIIGRGIRGRYLILFPDISTGSKFADGIMRGIADPYIATAIKRQKNGIVDSRGWWHKVFRPNSR